MTGHPGASTYLLPKAQGWTEERFGLLALNAKGDLLADRVLAHGTATACLISPREFFREALKFSVCSALAWHNHPSGDPTPSGEDIQLTKRLRAAGESLGVSLADHISSGKRYLAQLQGGGRVGYLWGLMGRSAPFSGGKATNPAQTKAMITYFYNFDCIFDNFAQNYISD